MRKTNQLIRFGALYRAGRAIGPSDRDTQNVGLLAEAEVRDRLHLAEIAAARIDRADLRALARIEGDDRATSGSAGRGRRVDPEPVIAIHRGMIE